MTDKPVEPTDEIRIIAPSTAWQPNKEGRYKRAASVLSELGFKVTYGKNIQDSQRFVTGSVAARAADLHDAYRDKNVKAVMALHGGWSANALLPHIDWQLLRNNPKPFIGFSDITVLLNAIYAKTGNVGYLGPNFASLGYERTITYTLACLQAILNGSAPLKLARSKRWEKIHGKALVRTQPWRVLQSGSATGTLVGGNIGTFYLLQGTDYLPLFDKAVILAVEDDDEAGKYTAREFDRRLESLLQLPGLRENLRGILVGRFQAASKVTMPDVEYIMKRMDLGNIPIVAGLDFGHTSPLLTLPIGGTVSISAENDKPSINLIKY